MIRMKCRYCGIIFEVDTFVQIEQVQSQDCFITLAGIKHALRREGDGTPEGEI